MLDSSANAADGVSTRKTYLTSRKCSTTNIVPDFFLQTINRYFLAHRSFAFADDIAVVATQHFDTTGSTLSSALDNLSTYYKENQLRANKSKTQVSLFHHRNKQ